MDKKTAIKAFQIVEKIDACQDVANFIESRQNVFEDLPQEVIVELRQVAEKWQKKFEKDLENFSKTLDKLNRI